MPGGRRDFLFDFYYGGIEASDMIEIKNVSFEYEKEQGTLSNINLNIQQGECVVL